MRSTEIASRFITPFSRIFHPQTLFRAYSRMALITALCLSVIGFSPAQPLYAEGSVHVVAPGESLGTIARSYNVSLRDLITQNGLSNPDVIVIGQRLAIPGTVANDALISTDKMTTARDQLPYGDGYYTVRRGDTLSQIAKGNGMDLDDMLRLNGLINANFLSVGQKLRVTARVAPIFSDEEDEPKIADKIYIVRAGDSLEEIASDNNMSLQALLKANGLPHENFTWVGQRLRIHPGAKPVGTNMDFSSAPSNGYRWIEVNLSSQTLTAWQGDVAVMHTYISSGVAATPTVTGRFRIGTKLTSQRMIGPGYDLPGVPWVMYFYGSYAIHGAYWHNNFGVPMSHGCVNMRNGDAQVLYNWAPAGTEVYVHY